MMEGDNVVTAVGVPKWTADANKQCTWSNDAFNQLPFLLTVCNSLFIVAPSLLTLGHIHDFHDNFICLPLDPLRVPRRLEQLHSRQSLTKRNGYGYLTRRRDTSQVGYIKKRTTLARLSWLQEEMYVFTLVGRWLKVHSSLPGIDS